MRCCRLALTLLALAPLAAASETTAVARHGYRSVRGSQIVDRHGEAVSLAGPSLFWSNDGWGNADAFYNKEALAHVQKDWKATIVRAAMGVGGRGGYLARPRSNAEKAIRVVDAAIELGLYVIIDWHDHHAEHHSEQALAFFDEMSRRYAGAPNHLRDLHEPLKASWSERCGTRREWPWTGGWR